MTQNNIIVFVLLPNLWIFIQQEKGVVPELFQLPEKFHLTLGVLRIFTQEEEVHVRCMSTSFGA